MNRHPLTLLLALSLVGCAQAVPVGPVPATVVQPAGPVAVAIAANTTVTATGTINPIGADGRSLLAFVSAWTSADIHHVDLTISTGGSVVGSVTVDQFDLAKPVTFTNLKQSKTYTILATAYSTSGSASPIDNSSVSLASCTTTFATTLDAAVSIGSIALQLRDKTFSGTGSTGLAINPGLVVDTASSVGVVVLPPYISTFAGTGAGSYSGDGGQAASASLTQPVALTRDSAGNLYIADQINHRIRKIDAAGVITTVAGSASTGGYGGDGGAATSALLNEPSGVVVDGGGNLYIADFANHRVRKVTPGGTISTYAGTGATGYNAAPTAATSSALSFPRGLALDAAGNLYIADTANHAVRRVDKVSGDMSTYAGNQGNGFSGDGGPAVAANFSSPQGLAVDSTGNLYIADYNNQRVRQVTPGGNVTTVAGSSSTGAFGGDGGAATSALLKFPSDLAFDPRGNLYISDVINGRVRKVDKLTGIISTFAGAGGESFTGDGGPALLGQFVHPLGIVFDASNNLYIADRHNHRIRKVR